MEYTHDTMKFIWERIIFITLGMEVGSERWKPWPIYSRLCYQRGGMSVLYAVIWLKVMYTLLLQSTTSQQTPTTLYTHQWIDTILVSQISDGHSSIQMLWISDKDILEDMNNLVYLTVYIHRLKI